jgi:DNA-binding response OmpR family regulator/ferredoxin
MVEPAISKSRVISEGGRNMKPILIVEDEAIMRESLEDWLKNSGYHVETATEGEEALRVIGERDFGIAVLDLKLPGKDGLEVLREAKERNPQIKGIIITAYPSVETAVEAMKMGAIDYLPKPFDLNELEERISKTLGPIQVEIRPKVAVEEAVAGPVEAETAEVKEVEVEEAEVEETIAIAPGEAPVHFKQGKAHFEAGKYAQALREFQAVLEIAPEDIENRVWFQKAKKALAAPEGEAAGQGAEKTRNCVWVGMGMISHRICNNNFNCATCEFDQEMQDKLSRGETSEPGTSDVDAAMEKLLSLPGNKRLCRYALKGDVSFRLCSRLYKCETCEFSQMMEDIQQQKLEQRAAALATRKKVLVSYYIDPEKCQGCMICSRSCPVGAITGGKKLVHVIDQEKCTRCGTCLEVCPPRFGAVQMLTGLEVPESVPEGTEVVRS